MTEEYSTLRTSRKKERKRNDDDDEENKHSHSSSLILVVILVETRFSNIISNEKRKRTFYEAVLYATS